MSSKREEPPATEKPPLELATLLWMTPFLNMRKPVKAVEVINPARSNIRPPVTTSPSIVTVVPPTIWTPRRLFACSASIMAARLFAARMVMSLLILSTSSGEPEAEYVPSARTSSSPGCATSCAACRVPLPGDTLWETASTLGCVTTSHTASE